MADGYPPVDHLDGQTSLDDTVPLTDTGESPPIVVGEMDVIATAGGEREIETAPVGGCGTEVGEGR